MPTGTTYVMMFMLVVLAGAHASSGLSDHPCVQGLRRIGGERLPVVVEGCLGTRHCCSEQNTQHGPHICYFGSGGTQNQAEDWSAERWRRWVGLLQRHASAWHARSLAFSM
eukprot:1918312-Rhodomonas_salina.4